LGRYVPACVSRNVSHILHIKDERMSGAVAVEAI